MKRLLFILTFLSLVASVFAQTGTPPAKMPVGGMAPGGMPPGGPGGPTAQVYGKIVDSDGKPLGDVSVLLLKTSRDTTGKKSKDILVSGITTKANGDFNFSDIALSGPMKLKISSLEYAATEHPVVFERGGGLSKDLGNISLKKEIKQLENVTVTASKPIVRMDGEKKIFNVDKDLVSAGGTAIDVMKNVPSVQVDIDGNVTMRNAQPTLFIDGRPTTLTLDQIPANAIESIEVITNPSAKYDASGGNAGILNIVLKKNKKSGYNGTVQAGVDKYGAVTGGGDLSIRQQKFNFSISANLNQNKGRGNGTTARDNFSQVPETSIFQTNTNRNNGQFMFSRVGFDYFATNRTTISVGAVKVHGEFKPNDFIATSVDSLYESGTTHGYYERTTTGKREFNGTGLSMGLKQLFPKEGQELTADINYFGGKMTSNSLYHTDYFAAKEGAVTDYQEQKLVSDGGNQFVTVQTDYVQPIKGKLKVETGLRAQLRSTKSNIDNYLYNKGTGDFDLVTDASTNYKNSDNVYAAYVSVSNTVRNFGYQLGLRAESSSYEGEKTNTGEKFTNQFPVSLFPSISLNQKLNKDQQLQFSYSRRINRPNFFQLIPFTDYTDPLNITRGNPDLVPEFTQSLELSYSKTLPHNHTILASTYYKYTDNLITRYQQIEYDNVLKRDVLVNSYINANNSRSVGVEVTAVDPIAKWWDMTTNVNLYNSKINTNDSTKAAETDGMWSVFAKWNNTFKLPKNFNIQLSGTFQSKTNLPVNQNQGFGPPMNQAQSASQGYIKANYGIDIAIKKSFLKNNALSATLSFNDIFRTRKMEQYSYNEYFTQDNYRVRDPQMVRLNLAYKFGKIDTSLFKRKNMKAGGEGMQME
ncbi:TonB-dependent receptor [Flavihumibacter profundi]|uniref:TonB-dependent receptor n=1 Tax=Flavihumibacter profundi TaxID=2716883 RepID=UPI001CC40104|nr:TonB-dependent receptor [Flavihumibacter profundi]MBZ5858666.1 TonB-dependent receptor [Flavihumibacter profundi]